MREKELKIVISFYNTTDAMAMENLCMEKDIAGRIIPLPKIISAGCGLAWSAPIDAEEKIRGMLATVDLKVQGIHYCTI